MNIVKEVKECLSILFYKDIEYMGNNIFRAISPFGQERKFQLSKFDKDFTLYSQKGVEIPLPTDFKVIECEFIEEDAEGNRQYRIFYSDYIIESEVNYFNYIEPLLKQTGLIIY